MRWLARFAEKTHPLVLPGVWVLAGLAGYAWVLSGDLTGACCWDNRTQMWGSALTYLLISGYFLYLVVSLHNAHRRCVRELQPVIPSADALSAALADPPPTWTVPAALLGAVFGAAQFGVVLEEGLYRANPAVDLSLITGNVVLWITAFFVLSCRVHDALLLRRLGGQVSVDLYHLERLRPFGRVAIRDVLGIMGALALSVLQSLDAEFRWVNYQTGLLVGLVGAGALLVLPQTGVHAAIRAAKAGRLAELQSAIDAVDRNSVVELEARLAHRERIRHLPTWPMDMALVGRVLFYLVIPPLAWVGAALVEYLVDAFLG